MPRSTGATVSTFFLDSADGTRLSAARWGDGARDVLVVHGLAEHAQRYAHVATAWAARGWTVTVLELRGHGHSGGRRGHVLRWQEYVEDVRAAAAQLRPGWCLFAHSMGGLVTLDALRQGLAPRRYAVSNPLVGVRVKAPAVKIAAGKALSRIWPTLALTNEIDPAGLSRDASIGLAYAKDPLVYNTITPRWYTEMEAARARVAAMSALPMPSRFFLSDSDPICDPVAAEALAQRMGVPVTAYPGMRHEIVNEIGKEQVISDLADFLEA